MAQILVVHVRELRARGLLRRRIDSLRLAQSMLQLASMQTLMCPEDTVERIVDETLALILDGALA